MKTYFTSDWHLGEDRIGVDGKPNLFYRPFDSVRIQNSQIKINFLKTVKDGDEIWHLGDVLYTDKAFDYFKSIRAALPNSKFNLVIGNYDEDKIKDLKKVFDTVQDQTIIEIGGKSFYLNHYPAKCIDKEFSITGHIHGLWKVQKNMINVGVDAWHFKPVSEEEILFCRAACEKYYDTNVFPY